MTRSARYVAGFSSLQGSTPSANASFTTVRSVGGSPGPWLTDGQIKCPLYGIRRRAGIVDVTCATQGLLGHCTIEVNMRYAHFSPVGLKPAVATLDRPISTPTAQEPAASRKPALSLASALEN